MHDDLPTDLERLRIIETYLLAQLERAREQHRQPGTHPELPEDRQRLAVVGKLLGVQLDRVRQQLHEAETGEEPWRSGPAPGWRMQHLPAPAGGRGRGVLHRADCFVAGGFELSRQEAVMAMQDVPGVEECQGCRPYAELRQDAAEG